MRPIKLTMSAFVSYAGKQEIDFEALGKEGLYLITGNTGSGKTTIFDAITFALYGKTSGNNKDVETLCSKYADLSTESFVDFTFQCRDKTYRIKRNPTYLRAKQRGEGEIKVNSGAELHLPDGRVVTRTEECNKEIKEILCINCEQFVRIVMIAQGEFMKILHADTKMREEIFRTLFYTNAYKIFQDKIKEDVKNLADEIKNQEQGKDFSIKSISVDTFNTERMSELSEIKLGKYSLDEVLEWLQKRIDEDTELTSANEKLSAEVTEQLGAANQKYGQAEQTAKTQAALASAESRLLVEKDKYEKAEAALNVEKSKQPEYEDTKQQISEVERSLPKYKQLQGLVDALAESEKSLSAKEKKITPLNEQQVQDSEKLEKDKTEFIELSDIDAVIERLKGQETLLSSKKVSLDSLMCSLKEYGDLKLQLLTAQNYYTQKSQVAKATREAFEEINTAFLNEQAGILAKELKDGEACLVCGSTAHPNPAVLSGKYGSLRRPRLPRPQQGLLERQMFQVQVGSNGERHD